jgi:hypothetical protein
MVDTERQSTPESSERTCVEWTLAEMSQVQLLLQNELRDLSHEIADTDLPAFRLMLREQRALLQSALDVIASAMSACEPADHLS